MQANTEEKGVRCENTFCLRFKTGAKNKQTSNIGVKIACKVQDKHTRQRKKT